MSKPRKIVPLPENTNVPEVALPRMVSVEAPLPKTVMLGVEQVNDDVIVQSPEQFNTSPGASRESAVVNDRQAVAGVSPLLASFPTTELT